MLFLVICCCCCAFNSGLINSLAIITAGGVGTKATAGVMMIIGFLFGLAALLDIVMLIRVRTFSFVILPLLSFDEMVEKASVKFSLQWQLQTFA